MDPTESDISKSMTWEDACRLADSWNKQHSLEDLVAVGTDEGKKERGTAYSRLLDDEGEDEDGDEEDDSTEVEGQFFGGLKGWDSLFGRAED